MPSSSTGRIRVTGIVSGINGILSSLAAEINGDFAGIASEIGSNIVGTGNSTIAHINNTVLGVAIGPGDPTNTINNKLRDYNPGGAERVIPGLTADIAHNGFCVLWRIDLWRLDLQHHRHHRHHRHDQDHGGVHRSQSDPVDIHWSRPGGDRRVDTDRGDGAGAGYAR